MLGRLEATKVDLKKSRELARIETTFSALNIQPNLTRSTNVHGDFPSSNKSNEDKIEEGVALLVKRGKDGKKIFKCLNCNEYGHSSSKFPKRVKKYTNNFKPRRSRECLYENDENLKLLWKDA